MKLALVTDAWLPQVNGVVTTLQRTHEVLEARGHAVTVVSPDQYRTLPCPSYPEIRLALLPARQLTRTLDSLEPDAIHIATEGPLGLAAAAYCTRRRFAFTTSYHTQFPQYLRKRAPIPESWSYAFLRRHHGRARRTLVATEHQRRDLVAHGFRNVVIWSRGVDAQLFKPGSREHLALPRPIFAYAGRVAVEKNLDAFLALDLPGTKVVIGDGPDRAPLERRCRNVRFLGYRFGAELANCLSATDVFVFPSRTDTFGLVMLEAMGCGTPVAAFPVTGPIDVVTHGYDGVLDEDLCTAALAALNIDRNACRTTALSCSWERAAGQFLSHLVRARDGGQLGLDETAGANATDS
ncbi:MAG: glycosyltransferase family 1 protein [Gammaproteobacteria bacterium]